MLKIAFINPNLHSDYPRPPLGLLSVATACKQAGYDVRIVDANALNLTPHEVANRCFDCEVVAITAMTPTISEAIAIADALWDKTIILGGVHASVFPDECASLGVFDKVVKGEGEVAILEVLASLNSRQKVYESNILDVNSIPLPDYSLLNLTDYRAHYPHAVMQPWTTVSTSRGCPYHCAFCFKAVSGDKFSALSTNRMMQLIYKLKSDHGINDVTFYDDIFTLDKNRVCDFCGQLITHDIKLTWTCESRVNLADYKTLELMKMAGCRMIYYGIESGSQSILNSLSKGISLSQVRDAVAITHAAGIQAAGYFMLGCPGETIDSMFETVEFAQSLELDHAQFSVCSPLPGSQLYSDYLKTGLPVPSWSQFKYLSNGDKPMFTSSELSKEDIETAVKTANNIYNETKTKVMK